MTNPRKRPHVGAGLLVAVLVAGGQPALAQSNGPTQVGAICMQKVFGTPVSNSNLLNCTANDIRLSRAISVSPGSCIAGEVFDLTATFETVVTANARYDAGFFFRVDGGANARGDGVNASGTCSLSALTPSIPPALNLDGDTCGDLNAGTYNVTFTIPGVLCQDTNGDHLLNLPNCTSWHSNQGTSCSIGNAFDFFPDTKSKCVCDDTFQVPVIVETASLAVTKSAAPPTVPETGQDVTYSVTVTNTAAYVSVTIASVLDDLYGNLGANSPPRANNTCPSLLGVVLAPGQSTGCSFQVFTQADAGTAITDTVTICGPQSNTGATICGSDDATVTITDVPSTPALTKEATSAVTSACTLTVDVLYTVSVSNPSPVDFLTVNGLTDAPFGDLTSVHGDVLSTTCVPDGNPATCEAGGVIAPLGSCSCTFVGRTSGGTVVGASCSYTHVDTATADVTDDDGLSSTPSDDATVNVNATINVSLP